MADSTDAEPRDAPCPDCDGKGYIDWTFEDGGWDGMTTCACCDGTGRVPLIDRRGPRSKPWIDSDFGETL
jgi:DnaJ-class molecular chaperone